MIGARCAGAATAMLLARAELAGLRGDQKATDHVFLATQGMLAPQMFFNDENIGPIMRGAPASRAEVQGT